MTYTERFSYQIGKLQDEIISADAILVGAGSGLSTAAGFTYSGSRFEENFGDFIEKYGFKDMYSGGFYPFDTLEEYWAYWSRYIYINRYIDAPGSAYSDIMKLLQGKDYFVLTTNVDHCFQKSGIDKNRLFYTQGDYGLWQCSKPCHQKTYDNESAVKKMLEDQKNMRIPSHLIPHCPVCGADMSMNLRSDITFVEDNGWHKAASRYRDFLTGHKDMHILFLELGVGNNTPGIIKYPFWKMTYENPKAFYACINMYEAYCPPEISAQSVCIEADTGMILHYLEK